MTTPCPGDPHRDMDVSFHEVLDPNNELGVKGIGEGGAGRAIGGGDCGIDALKHLGVTARYADDA